MTLEQLIAQFRVDSDDQSSDPLSSDEQVIAWLNEAEEEAAIRAHLIHESDDASVCEISIAAGTTIYPIHESIVDITRADFTPDGATVSTPVALVDRIEQDRTRPDWRTTTEVPREAILMDTKLRMGCIPSVDGTLKIECYRTPLNPMVNDSDTPEINRAHHRHLVKWALHKCYARPDAEIHDPARSEKELAEFTHVFGIRPDADLRRGFQENRPLYNKAIA